MPQFVLIIGADPALVDFDAPGAPPGLDAGKVLDGLNGSRDRLIAGGFEARVLLTRGAAGVAALVAEAVAERVPDVAVIGAGLRTLPAMADEFERLVNALRDGAPGARLAFNSRPNDSDVAALRWLPAPPGA